MNEPLNSPLQANAHSRYEHYADLLFQRLPYIGVREIVKLWEDHEGKSAGKMPADCMEYPGSVLK